MEEFEKLEKSIVGLCETLQTTLLDMIIEIDKNASEIDALEERVQEIEEDNISVLMAEAEEAPPCTEKTT